MEIVAWQYRWLNPSGSRQPESMLKWQLCESKYPGQSVEDRVKDLLSYETDGKPQYEVRPLFAMPHQDVNAPSVKFHETIDSLRDLARDLKGNVADWVIEDLGMHITSLSKGHPNHNMMDVGNKMAEKLVLIADGQFEDGYVDQGKELMRLADRWEKAQKDAEETANSEKDRPTH